MGSAYYVLYTPVVGNKRYPGDLWGVDAVGNLLIIECKQCRRSDDPFIDFVRYMETGIDREELTGANWQLKFRRHFASECSGHTDCTGERAPGKTDGILPRSNRRNHIRRWPELAKRIDGMIRDSEYPKRVATMLERREERGNPPPYFIGLMAISKEQAAVLSADARISASRLKQIVEPECVLTISVRAIVQAENTLKVSASVER